MKHPNDMTREELAALKAQSTEPVAWEVRLYGGTRLLEFDKPERELLGSPVIWAVPLYPTPPTAAALLESLGDWVHERMQQADADYHDHGDDTAEVYATLKMVLSKIESMIEGENHGRHE